MNAAVTPSSLQSVSAGGSHAPAAHIRSTEHVPEWKMGRGTLERGLFTTQYNAVPLKDLSLLYPASEFRTVVAGLAQRFIRDYEAKGYQLLTPLSDVLVYGPYQSRDLAAMLANSAGKDMRAVGYQLGEDPFADTADVVLKAQFLMPYRTTNDHLEADTP